MRVTFNSFRDESLTHLNREAANQGRIQAQITSGQKISRADEDPLIAQKILGLQSTNAQTQQFSRNAGSALDVSRGSFNAVDELRKVSDRVGEIAAGIGEMTTPQGMRPYGVEVNGLIEQAVQATNQTLDGKYLLGGTKNDAPPFTIARDGAGKVTSITYAGAAQGPAFQISEAGSISPYTDGESNAEMADFINRLVAVRTALEDGDAAALSAQRAGLQESEDAVLGTLGKIGAQQRRLEINQESVAAHFEETAARISSLNDVDLSQAIVAMTKSQTAYQAGLQTTAKIMSQSLLDYI